VRYVELRSPDINIFEPVGISAEQIRVLETLMLYCLLLDSPRIGTRERREIDENQVRAAHRGREPGLELVRDHTAVPLRVWASEILADMKGVAALLDGDGEGAHAQGVGRQSEKVADPNETPSARILQIMRDRKEGFFAFARRYTEAHRETFKQHSMDPERAALLDRLARESIAQQREIEAADDRSFDDFLADYFGQGRAVDIEGVGSRSASTSIEG
jgi:glutamate--cysteine ligase